MSDENYDYGDEAGDAAKVVYTAAAEAGKENSNDMWGNLGNAFGFYIVGGFLYPIGVLLAMFNMHTWFYDLMTGLDMYAPEAKSLTSIFNPMEGAAAASDDSADADAGGD